MTRGSLEKIAFEIEIIRGMVNRLQERVGVELQKKQRGKKE